MKAFYFGRFVLCTLFYGDSYMIMYMNAMINLILMLQLLVYSFLDGIYLSIRVKIIILLFGCVFGTGIAVYWTYIEWMMTAADNNSIERIIQFQVFNVNMAIRTFSYAASSLRILLIFVWKQTILLIWKRDKSTLIDKSVIIHWMN